MNVKNKIRVKRLKNWIDRKPDRRKKASKSLTIARLVMLNVLVYGACFLSYSSLPSGMSFENAGVSTDVVQSETSMEVRSQDTGDHISVKGDSIEEKIKEVFPDEPIMVAVLKAESGLKADAKGWNCRYGTSSKACSPEDRHRAWSVDCGLAQLNVSGKECPAELLDVDHSLKVARKMYDQRGLSPWVAWKSGAFKKFL